MQFRGKKKGKRRRNIFTPIALSLTDLREWPWIQTQHYKNVPKATFTSIPFPHHTNTCISLLFLFIHIFQYTFFFFNLTITHNLHLQPLQRYLGLRSQPHPTLRRHVSLPSKRMELHQKPTAKSELDQFMEMGSTWLRFESDRPVSVFGFDEK